MQARLRLYKLREVHFTEQDSGEAKVKSCNYGLLFMAKQMGLQSNLAFASDVPHPFF
jgi:hypothetical protein